MAIDAGIFSNALRPLPTAQEYIAANLGNQQNALKVQGDQQALSDQNALRQATMQFGSDQNQNLDLLRKQGLFAQAQALQKAGYDNQHTQAQTAQETSMVPRNLAQAGNFASETAARDQETQLSRRQQHLSDLAGVNDLPGAKQWLLQAAASGELPLEQVGQVWSNLQTNPDSIPQWKEQAKLGGMKLIDQMKFTTPDANASLSATTSSANNAATNATSRQNNSATVGATLRGQNLVDARASQLMDQPEYKQQDDGSFVALPKKVAPGAAITATPVMGANGQPLLGAGKPLTDGQGKATTFAARMQDAEGTIGQLEQKGIKGSDLRTVAAGNPYTNFLATPEGQQYRQAQENWVTANLRQESGAAIGKDEMAKDVAKFFAKPGDSDAVITQKSRARSVAAQGMLAQAGPGAKQVAGILSKAGAGAQSAAPAPTRIASDADYNSLPSGAEFIAPDGSHRKKP